MAAGVREERDSEADREFGYSTGIVRKNKAHQATFDFMKGEPEPKSSGFGGGMRDAYLKEREVENQRSSYGDQRQGSSYGGSR